MLTRREYLRALGAVILVWSARPLQAANLDQGDDHSRDAHIQDDDVIHQVGWPLWMSRGKESYYFDAMTPQGYEVARYLLRDIQAGGVRGNPDPWLLRALAQMQVWWAQYGYHVRFDVTSGLRTPKTNNSVEGAARASLHLPQRNWVFRAVDFRPGRVDPMLAARWARYAGIGGIGIYLDRDFLHVDTGRARNWISR